MNSICLRLRQEKIRDETLIESPKRRNTLKNLFVHTAFVMMLAIGILFIWGGTAFSNDHRENCYCGKYKLVPGEYDAKLGVNSSGKPEYATHKTMFLLDSHTGKVWLFVVESDWFKASRWGWIPAKGFRERIPAEKKSDKKTDKKLDKKESEK